jgi:tetratricopeptide (TPR) repeat protein
LNDREAGVRYIGFRIFEMVKIPAKIKNGGSRKSTTGSPDLRRNGFILGAILVFTLLLFGRAKDFYFVTWDDPQYLIENHIIRDLSFNGLVNIFTTPVIGMYNPVTFLVYSVVFKFFGLDPNAYHVLNIFLHILATGIVFRFMMKLTGRYETAAIVGLLFAIHPMHVSVAVWVSQTKTSLCTIFFFTALLYYVRYLKEGYGRKNLFYVGLYFLLAVLSKPSAVTITPLLFLLDYYFSRTWNRRLFVEKIPFLALSVSFGILTLVTHANEGDSIFILNHGYSLLNNFLIGNYSIVFYIEKLFLPLKLSTIYPYPEQAVWLPLKYYLSVPVIPLLIYLTYKAGRFRKEMVFGLLFFVISISVLVRIIPAGAFMSANRYSYISYTGLFFIIGQFVVYNLDGKFTYSWKAKKYVLASLAFFILFYSYRTTIRVSKWENGVTLFDDVIAKYPKVMEAYTNRGYAKEQMGDHEGAYVDYNTAVDLNPKASQTYLNRAILTFKMGKDEESISDFSKVVGFHPDFGDAYFYRGILRKRNQDPYGALKDFKSADSLGVTAAKQELKLLEEELIDP